MGALERRLRRLEERARGAAAAELQLVLACASDADLARVKLLHDSGEREAAAAELERIGVTDALLLRTGIATARDIITAAVRSEPRHSAIRSELARLKRLDS